MCILLIEDDAALRDTLRTRLNKSGFRVEWAADGEEGLYAGLNYPVELAIVDLGLPRRDGVEVIRGWRAAKRTFPIIILSARSGWENRILGLQAGADDYVEKPFNYDELLTRARIQIHRSHGWSTSEIVCHPFALDTQSRIVRVCNEVVDLTSREFRVLEALMLDAGKVVSGTTLLERIYDESVERDSNVIQHYVSRVRNKIDPEGLWSPIETIYGGGYRFVISKGHDDLNSPRAPLRKPKFR